MPLDIDTARATLEGAHRHAAADLRGRIQELARPRLSGTEGAMETEEAVCESLEAMGYQTTELPFSFSTWPGRWGLPVAGGLLVLTGGFGAWLVWAGLPTAALVVLAVGMALALLPLLLLGPALRHLPFGRLESRNLLFTRPGSRPAWLVMAHRDSKSQLAPTLLRTAALGLGAVGWLALVVLAALWFAGELYQFPAWALVAGGAVVLAGVVLALSWAANDSPGALDNATGLAALLTVAEALEGGEVGFLVTDGEELGLAGARAVVDELPAIQGVVNLDGLDDRGVIRVAEGHGWRRKGSAPQLAAALLTAGRVLDIDLVRQPLPRSILVDHEPLAASGIPALTVLRGDWRTLLRVHRSSDGPDRLSGSGAAESATLLTAALRLLREAGREHLAGG